MATTSRYATSQDWWGAQQLLNKTIIPNMEKGETRRKAQLHLLVLNHFAITPKKFDEVLNIFIEAGEIEEVEDGKSVKKN
jgi:hypothetical protein